MSESMHLLTGAYAVNALDPAERAEFEAHLADCPDCVAEIRGLRDTTSRLAAAEAVEPPARLKAAVLAQIAQTPQLAPLDPGSAPAQRVATGASAEPVDADEPAERQAADSGGLVVPMRRPGWGLAQRSLGVAAAILAVLAIGLTTLLVQASSARNQVDATQQAITRVLTAPDARALTGTLTGGGKASIVVSPSQGTTVFLGSGLRAAPAGHTYELWYMGVAGAVPAGTFEPDSNGQVARVLTGDVGGASAVGVTVEPAGGSKQPTTTPVLALRLTP